VYAALGSRVTVVEMMDGLLPGVDRDLVQPLARRVEKLFAGVHLGARVAGLVDSGAVVEARIEGQAAMVNLLGDVWAKGEPKWSLLDAIPGAKLYLYGKSEARSGRKMGHYTVVGAAADAEFSRADQRLQELRG